MPFLGFVVNRVHPGWPDDPTPGTVVAALEKRPELAGTPPFDLVRAAEPMVAAGRELDILADADELQIRRLKQAAPDRPLAVVPIQDEDVHDVRSLGVLGRYVWP
jgi:hypothetical protein